LILTHLVIGAAGQDGVILSRKLKALDIEVVGVCKSYQSEFLNLAVPSLKIDEFDGGNIKSILDKYKPKKIYNLAGYSSVKFSWENPFDAVNVNASLVAEIIEWIYKKSDQTILIQASSSEIFANIKKSPQNESTELMPSSPYGASKALAHQLILHYKQRYSLNLGAAILYNHESPLRKSEFLSKHLAEGIADIFLNKQSKVKVGNLDSKRDWGWAPDYVNGIYEMSNQDVIQDYIFATGKQSTVREFAACFFSLIGVENFEDYLEIDTSALRQIDPTNLCGDSNKALKDMGWSNSKNLQEIASEMFNWELVRNASTSNIIWGS
jgi:GDPmannose 4,6-dehydratase